MITVRDVLRDKGNQTWSAFPETTVFDALKLMAEKNIGAVIVLDGETIVGIFSERDYARKVILYGKSSKETTLREVMTTEVVSVRPPQSMEEGMVLMTDKRIRHLPVVEGEKLVGMISIGDVVKAIIRDKDFLIRQLEHYITGTP